MNKHTLTPCENWAEKLAATHINDLTPFEKKSLNKHVEVCPTCAFVLTSYLEMDAQLRNTSVTDPLPGLPPQLLQLWKKQDHQRRANISSFMPSYYVLLVYSLIVTGIGIYVIFKTSFQLPTWIPIIFVTMLITTGGGLYVTMKMADNEDEEHTFNEKNNRNGKQRSISLERYEVILLAFILSFIVSVPSLLTLVEECTTQYGATNGSVNALTSPKKISFIGNIATYPLPNQKLILFDNPFDIKGTDNATSSSACQFVKVDYHVQTTDGSKLNACLTPRIELYDLTVEVQMTFYNENGFSGGGIVFRADPALQSFYSFNIYENGTYALYRVDTLYRIDTLQEYYRTSLINGSSPAIKAGLNQSNRIAIVAIGNALNLFVNHQKIVYVSDSTYSHGEVGVAASFTPGEVSYSNLSVWSSG